MSDCVLKLVIGIILQLNIVWENVNASITCDY